MITRFRRGHRSAAPSPLTGHAQVDDLSMRPTCRRSPPLADHHASRVENDRTDTRIGTRFAETERTQFERPLHCGQPARRHRPADGLTTGWPVTGRHATRHHAPPRFS
jgi:hypothetical protein